MKKNRKNAQAGSHGQWSRKKENFYLWMFIAQEGLFEEASDFIFENMCGRIAYARPPRDATQGTWTSR